MTILSKVPDGCGFFYGFHESDPRQINVRPGRSSAEHNGWPLWIAYVGSDQIGDSFETKDEAEAAAIRFLQTGIRSASTET